MPVRPPMHRPIRADRPGRMPEKDPDHGRHYGRDWRRLRLSFLQRHPLCRFCQDRGLFVEATEVDHIAPIVVAPHRRLDETNLRPLCKPCHSARTAADQQAGRRV